MKTLQKMAAGVVLLMPMTAFAGSPDQQNIVAIAADNPSFSTLVTALKAAELVDVLQGSGPFTVFAPTDEAFSAVPESTLQHLLKPENKSELQSVLTYHVVSGKVDATTAMTLSEATTVQGENISISFNGQTVNINDASVVAADIEASNGIIHVIDQVILPPSLTAAAKINQAISEQPTAAGSTTSLWDDKLRKLSNPAVHSNL